MPIYGGKRILRKNVMNLISVQENVFVVWTQF
jgi:hypothetical protein